MLTIPVGLLASLTIGLGDVAEVSAVLPQGDDGRSCRTWGCACRNPPNQASSRGFSLAGASLHPHNPLRYGAGLRWSALGKSTDRGLHSFLWNLRPHQMVAACPKGGVGARECSSAAGGVPPPHTVSRLGRRRWTGERCPIYMSRCPVICAMSPATAPSFDYAVFRHRIIEAIERSAGSGNRAAPA